MIAGDPHTKPGRDPLHGFARDAVFVSQNSADSQDGRLLPTYNADASPGPSIGIETTSEMPPLVIAAAAMRVRRGKDVKLVFADTHGSAQQADGKLVVLLAEAHAAREAIVQHPEWTMRDAAAKLKQCRSRLAQLVRLSFLNPEIVAAIQKGSHPVALTPRALLTAQLPMRWVEQRTMLGFRQA